MKESKNKEIDMNKKSLISPCDSKLTAYEINDNSNSHGENSEDYNRHIYGNNGKKYNIELLKDIHNNILNIDMMIINDLQDLFMGLY